MLAGCRQPALQHPGVSAVLRNFLRHVWPALRQPLLCQVHNRGDAAHADRCPGADQLFATTAAGVCRVARFVWCFVVSAG